MHSAKEVQRLAGQLTKKLIAIRHDIHAHPELGFEEKRTNHKITGLLKSIGLNKVLSPVAGTGVIGLLIGGKGNGKTVALRADIDALPIQEENDVPYKSRHLGVMHACGHDAHVAMLLGAAMILKRLQKDIRGQVKFIFQPAEERLNGAPSMIRAGALENPRVDAICALHVDPTLELGTVGCRAGPTWAAADRFIIEIKGRGGHGAAHHKCIDPILVANHIYSGLESIERNLEGTDARVISVCSIHGGQAFNVIPDTVMMEGTVRTFDKKVQAVIVRRMRAITAGIALAHGAKVRLNYQYGVPAVINHAKVDQLLRQVARELGMKIITTPARMGGEDFAFYLKKTPGAMARIGILTGKRMPEWHTNRFDAGDRILPIGAALLAHCALTMT